MLAARSTSSRPVCPNEKIKKNCVYAYYTHTHTPHEYNINMCAPALDRWLFICSSGAHAHTILCIEVAAAQTFSGPPTNPAHNISYTNITAVLHGMAWLGIRERRTRMGLMMQHVHNTRTTPQSQLVCCINTHTHTICTEIYVRYLSIY